MITLKHFLTEGGAGGHVAHPFDIVSNGQEFIDLFDEAISDIKTGHAGKSGSGWVKLDGINLSVRIVNNQFVLDRGSAKPLDLKGLRPEDFAERQLNPGLASSANKLLTILDHSFNSTKSELAKLGPLSDPNLIINLEFVEGKTNVIKYDIENFIAIHGLRRSSYNPETKKRTIVDIPYDVDAVDDYVAALRKTTLKYGFDALGNPGVRHKGPAINSSGALSQRITLNDQTKTLKDWLLGIKEIPNKNGRAIIIKKAEYKEILNGDKKNLSDDHIRGFILYKAAIDLGDVILGALTSDLGELSGQEGLMMKRHNGQIYKITGSFIIKGSEETQFLPGI